MSLCVCEGDEVGDGGPPSFRPSSEMEKTTNGEVWKAVTVHVDPVATRSLSKQPDRAPMDPRRRRQLAITPRYFHERRIL